MAELKIALAGNPNSGKSTLFNALTGSAQYVGNWPGVTVERKEGRVKGRRGVILQDLPGIYSLSPCTPEEIVTRRYLVTERPAAILNIIDGTNLERNLYLTTQLRELGLPLVLAVNMMDLVQKRGDSINLAALGQAFGCPVRALSATDPAACAAAAEAAITAASAEKTVQPNIPKPPVFNSAVENSLAQIKAVLAAKAARAENKTAFQKTALRWYAVKLFERDAPVLRELGGLLTGADFAKIEAAIQCCEQRCGVDAEALIADGRYTFIEGVVRRAVQKKPAAAADKNSPPGPSDTNTPAALIDRITTNRVLALPIFALILYAVYWLAVGPLGSFLAQRTTAFFAGAALRQWVGAQLAALGVADWLCRLLTQGVLGGVGAVLGFVPQLMLLFFLLAILEDVGYMARIAFMMDRLFRRFGLSGKSLIPMLVATGCGVTGVLAARTIESERERRITVITACLMPCSAKMPVVALFAGAFFGAAHGGAAFALAAYLLGAAAVPVLALLLKKSGLFAGPEAPFVLELPPYHLPAWGSVLRAAWHRSRSFIERAGSVILLCSVLLWFLQAYGLQGGALVPAAQGNSLLAAVGRGAAWVFAPLGFGQWQAAVAVLAGLAGKENIVSALAVLYPGGVRAGLLRDFSRCAGASFVVFNLLCTPCAAAMAAMRQELHSTKQGIFAFGCLFGFAYAAAFVVYRLGLLALGLWDGGSVVAIGLLALLLYMLWRPAAKK